jgi:uncharacterized protein (DUF1697 family)
VNKYAIFLRGVNVGKKNRIKMEELKAVLIEEELFNVQTYIQSGNIVLESELEQEEVKMLVEDVLYEDFDIDTKCRVIDFNFLQESINEDLFVEYIGERVFISICDPKFDFEVDTMSEREDIIIIEVHDNIVITCARLIDGKTPDVNYFLEGLSKGYATTRNTKTIKGILSL